MKIPGYTLHGDYYLADKVITNVNWEQACKIKEVITLPNGKTVIAHILSKEELENISKRQRECGKWYWTSTHFDDDHTWYLIYDGGFDYSGAISYSNANGGARLGFHKNEIKQFLDIE